MSGEADYSNVLVGVGGHTWYAPSVLTLMSEGFKLIPYLHRHAHGDPGETAIQPEEVMAHAMFISEPGFPVISAYRDDEFGVFICFLTNEDQDTTYVFSIAI